MNTFFTSSVKRLLQCGAAICVLSAGMILSHAQGIGFQLTSGSYTAVLGGTVSGSINMVSVSDIYDNNYDGYGDTYFGYVTDWEIHSQYVAPTEVVVAGSGITTTYQEVDWPVNNYGSENFTVNIPNNGSAGYDFNGTLSVDGYDPFPNYPWSNVVNDNPYYYWCDYIYCDPAYYSPSPATITIYNPNTVMNVEIIGNPVLTEGESAQSTTIRIYRADAYNTRTVSYTIGGDAINGSDYSAPLTGSVTIYAGSYYVDITVWTGNDVAYSKTLTVTLDSDPKYQVGANDEVTITFLPSGQGGSTDSNNPDNTDTGGAQIFQPINPTLTGINVSGQKNDLSGTTISSPGNSPFAFMNVQATAPYATSRTPGIFTITRSGGSNAFTLNYTIAGTAVAGTNYVTLPTSVHFGTNQTSTNLLVSVLTNTPLTAAQTVVLLLSPSTNYFLGYSSQDVITLLPDSSLTNSVTSPTGRYWRGSGSDPTYWSQVIPLDDENGTIYSNLNGNCSALYPGLSSWSSQTLYHYDATNSLPQNNTANRIAFNNPVVAFGERTGGTPLYFNQPYNFGIYAGDPLLAATQIVIQVYYRTNNGLAGSINVVPPNYSNTNSMSSYATNGFQVTTNAFGLTTTLSDSPTLNWGTTSLGAYVLTHTASSQSTNYYYLITASGYPADGSNAMVITSGGAVAPSLLYTLEFESRPPWRSIFLDRPQFASSPLPPFYAGKTLAEMLTNTPPVTNVVNFTPSAATNLDDSPELRRHLTLDNFVASMGNDPIALANYVINNIDLTDPMDYSDNGNIAEQSINPGGVSRGALGTFMEKQGSPADQCALLVYLLRQAGVPAVYEFAPRNGLEILDARLSQMLKFQVHGAFSEAGQLYTTNTMIPVNYPWVAAYIGTNWVHIFPWLKDYQITEGFNLYEYMPTNYSSAYPWVRDYIYGNTNLTSLAVDGDNTPRVIFPAYLKKTLLQNHPGISVDDIGVQILNRQHYYSRWQDFPTPTWVTNVSTPLESLTSSGSTNISPTLVNIFDTVSVEIYSVNNPTNDIQTGDLRLVDLHNREFYVSQTMTNANQVRLNLVLMPFRTNVTSQFAYTNDSNLLSKEVMAMTLGTNDNQMSIRFKYHRHRALSSSFSVDPSIAFLGYNACQEIDLERPFWKGDQAAICIDYGRVTQDMLNVHAADLWQMENALQFNPSLTNSISSDVYVGATMYLAGMSYYKKVSDFNQVNQNLHKVNVLSSWAVGLSKINAARDSLGNLINGVDPVLPNVDMFFYEAAYAANGTVQADSGAPFELAQQNFNLISIVNNSAEEHQIINRFYQQTNAVSTVRLLQLSQSIGSGIVALNYNNYLSQGQVAYQGRSLQSWDASLWSSVVSALQNSPYAIAYITPGPMTNSSYSGMAALILGWNGWQALITPKSLNGAVGQNFPPQTISSGNSVNFFLNNSGDFTLSLTPPASGSSLAPTITSDITYDNAIAQMQNNQFVLDNFDLNWNSQVAGLYNLPTTGTPNQTFALSFQTSQQQGDLGNVGLALDQKFIGSSDPVQNITGEFHVDETDLELPGPMPLSLRRNYSSQNLADNQFGTGWKFSLMHYLSMTAGGTNIYAADMDGAVLVYVRQDFPTSVSSVAIANGGHNYQVGNILTITGGSGTAAQIQVNSVNGPGAIQTYTLLSGGQYTASPSTPNSPTGGAGSGASFNLTMAVSTLWQPTLAANPQLNNNTAAGVGGLANRLRNRIVQTVNGSTTNYTLYGADGSTRIFQVMAFNNGILNQTRPYLQTWTDSRGNYYSFTYGTDSSQPNFGEVTRIQSSNGNYLGFNYDIYGHILEAYSGDGRSLTYGYDQYGDLINVTLPDESTRSYIYQHATQTVTNYTVVYPTNHLIATRVAAGGSHSLFLETDGSLRVMGTNSSGELGDGTYNNASQPELIVASNVVAIAAGYQHSLFLKSGGSLWAMGANSVGQLGDGTYNNTNRPELIVASNVTAIAAGYQFSLFLKSGGSLWAIGDNESGQRGDGTTINYTNRPELIIASNVTAIAAGDFHSLFLKSDGSLWAMGYNYYGQLGDGANGLNANAKSPVLIVASNVVAIAAGGEHSLFLKSDGSLWAMGSDGYGQLGDGTFNNAKSPEQILASNVVAIVAGEYHSLIEKSDGSLWFFGNNNNGELGDGTYYNTNRPEQIVAGGGAAMAGGANHSLFLKNDGSLWVMGFNNAGQLGDGTFNQTNRPEQILTGSTNIPWTSPATYSTHLIVEEDKPDGRALQNIYDSQRRVTNQLSTAGADLTPIRTARFIYANNYNFTNSYTNTISGYTLVVDANNHTNRYDYTNSLITQITDPLGQTIQQIWYANNTAAPGYPRSLFQIVDKRGMTNQFQYDSNGNVTNIITFGDLTGDGIASQTATNTAVYNTNNLPTLKTDAAGNSTVIVYDPVFNFLPQQIIRYAGTTPVSTSYTVYGNATNVVVNGNVTQTNLAFGLPVRQIRAYGSTDAATNDFTYSGNGFLTQSIRYPGTGDPNVINTFYYNERGQMVNQVDALGAITAFDYDALNRPTAQENFDENGNALSWSFNYYNENGELNWVDGPRYNPEDYVFYDYDGAGRRTTEIHWRSEAKADGSGVESPAGFNQYAQSFYQYDPVGNLTLAVDPRGAMTTNTWDALNRLARRNHLDTNGATVLSSEGFGYEPGGLVKFYTNALGGITTTLYTTGGLPEYRSNPDGSTNGWRYYLDGRIKREIQGNGAYWQTTYDDVNRIATRIFYSAAGVPEATTSVQLDRRGNAIQRMDAGTNVFTATYDDLDRVKVSAGPAIVTVTSYQLGNPPSGPFYYVTNVLQQASTNFYDAAGRTLTNVNALGETTITKIDALGRTISITVYSASSSLVREKYFAYSSDHNSVTVTDGSGASAISHTTWTDNDGHTVLSIAYPSSGVNEFALNKFDLAGNLVLAQHDSSAGGAVTIWTTTCLAYDGLNRLTKKVDRDNASTTYGYDALNDLTSRNMPGNLAWSASYNNAGQMLMEWNSSGSAGTRTNTYGYFTSGNPFAGLLQTKSDGRGVTCTYAYDDRLRVTTNTYTGSLAEQNLTTTWQYEPRGFVTGITEQFSSTNTGSATSIQRTFDPYGQLATESVNDGAYAYGASQSWNAAGRRTQLGIGGNNYGFVWQADGGLTSISDSTGSGGYSYNTAGLLLSRTIGTRLTSISSRDGEGRPLSINTTVNTLSQLNETLAWSGDGLLASHTLTRGDSMTDARGYSYANLSRRLTQEQLNLNASTTWTNTFAYDNGIPAGLGVLTSAGTSAATWSGLEDSFSRVSTSTNNVISYAAYGHVNGQSTLNAWLDNQPVPVTGVGTNAMQWRSALELSQGTHQLTISALHPSGRFTAWATNSFTNSLAYEATTDSYDNAGNITNRVWKNPGGTVERTQTLSWDARGRLHSVTERDAGNSGYNWTATYDGLNRRLSTTSILVTNGVVFTTLPTTINSYFDPQVEFLELGVAYGTTTEWKLYGPDLDGQYGGMNGTGGFEGVSPYLNLFYPTISDFRGNILGVVTNGVVSWNPARPTGYGAVPGYRPVALGSGAGISLSSAWRGHWVDITGYHQLGLRPYDPVSGRWLTYDSVWNDLDPNAYTFCGGDPVNGFDSNGKCVENAPNAITFGIAPVMQTSLQTTTYFLNGSSATTGLPGQPDIIYDPSTVSGNSYNVVTQPTGQYQYYVSQNGLPENYGQATSVPVNRFEVEQQQSLQGLEIMAMGLMSLDGTGEFLDAAGFRLAAETTATRAATTLGETTYNVSFGSTGNPFLDSVGIQDATISNVRITVDQSLTGADLANVTAHEGFHAAVAQNFPNFAASSGRLPYIGAFPLYAEEVGAYGYGAINAGQYSQALMAPVSAFQSLNAGQTISVLGTGAAAGSLWYYGHH